MRLRAAVAWLAVAWLFASSRPAHGVEESRTVELGRPFHYRFTIDHGAGEAIQRPLRPSLPPSFELLSIDIAPVEGRGSEVELRLALFDYRERELPSFEVPIEGARGALRTLESPALPLAVRSLLGAPSPLTPTRSMRGLLEEHSQDSLLSTRVLVAALSALLLAYFLWWLRARRHWTRLPTGQQRTTASQGRRAPSEEALAAIEQLEASSAIEEEDAKPALIRLSAILRRYLAHCLDASAEGRSGEELRAALGEQEAECSDWGRQMAEWIGRCERTRYSGASVSPDEAREFLYEARRLLQSDRAPGQRGEAGRA